MSAISKYFWKARVKLFLISLTREHCDLKQLLIHMCKQESKLTWLVLNDRHLLNVNKLCYLAHFTKYDLCQPYDISIVPPSGGWLVLSATTRLLIHKQHLQPPHLVAHTYNAERFPGKPEHATPLLVPKAASCRPQSHYILQRKPHYHNNLLKQSRGEGVKVTRSWFSTLTGPLLVCHVGRGW